MYESHLKTPFADLLLDEYSFEGILLTNKTMRLMHAKKPAVSHAR
jgi:hypothetical protein